MRESATKAKLAEAERVVCREGNMCAVVKRDGDAPPGSRTASRPQSLLRDLGDPAGSGEKVVAGGVGARDNRSPASSRGRKSDRSIIPTIPPKEPRPAAGTRLGEGRGRHGGSLGGDAKVRTQSRAALPAKLAWVKELAAKDKRAQFTALLHHLDCAALEKALRGLKRNARAGVDGETVAEYERNLAGNLQDLCRRIHTGTYRPQPVLRVYIPKPKGGQRPLGIPALEDKIVQSAVAEVLNAVYEADFLGFSYGFRPGKSQHQALAALRQALLKEKVNWVLDADFRKFFDSVDHEWLLRMVAHRIADPRMQRLVRRWLKAGVLEHGDFAQTERGTPQGSCISPLLANIFLHYVLDLWVQQWRRKQARGRVIIVRYADDFVVGFQWEEDGKRFLAELKTRLAKFSLELHEDKTRLLEFGRFAASNRRQRGTRRPETFVFLGFTHYCAETEQGWFTVKVKTESGRLTRKLKQLRVEARRRMHLPVRDQHRWLCAVLRGHYLYYGWLGNRRAMGGFALRVRKIWQWALKRRSQKSRMNWERYRKLLDIFTLPKPHDILGRVSHVA